jgi:hypothetical protein
VVRVPGFDSRRYEIWEVVGLERGPLSLMSTTEELLGRKSSGFGMQSREYGRRDPFLFVLGKIHLSACSVLPDVAERISKPQSIFPATQCGSAAPCSYHTRLHGGIKSPLSAEINLIHHSRTRIKSTRAVRAMRPLGRRGGCGGQVAAGEILGPRCQAREAGSSPCLPGNCQIQSLDIYPRFCLPA